MHDFCDAVLFVDVHPFENRASLGDFRKKCDANMSGPPASLLYLPDSQAAQFESLTTVREEVDVSLFTQDALEFFFGSNASDEFGLCSGKFFDFT